MRDPSPLRRENLLTRLGWVAVTMLLVGPAISLIPVSNPGVQDCGVPLAWAIDARGDLAPDASGRVARGQGEPERLNPAEVRRARTSPCSDRVAGRLIPAGLLGAGGIVLGTGVVLGAWIGAWRARPARRALFGAETDDG